MLLIQFITSSFLALFSLFKGEELSKPTRIAIIGGGPSGLGALQGLLDVPEKYKKKWTVDLFESRNDVGGIWLPDSNYTVPAVMPDTGLYPSLYTVGSGMPMTIPGYPFPPSSPLHVHHWQILAYHQDLIRQFNLDRYIRLNNRVLDVNWDGAQWEVKVAVRGEYEEIRHYDKVVIASGKHQQPRLPQLPGEDLWIAGGLGHREIMHSKWFRKGEMFKGRMVIVLGSGHSGRAVVSQTVPFASQVIHSWNPHPEYGFTEPLPNTTHVPKLLRFTSNSLIFEDGTEMQTPMDAVIIACTGYELSYPYLRDMDVVDYKSWNISSTNHKLARAGNHIRPLYRMVFANQPEYPLNALSFAFFTFPTDAAPSAYANGLLLAHSIIDTTILDSKEDASAQLLADEYRQRQTGQDPLPVMNHFDDSKSSLLWSNSHIDLIRARAQAPSQELITTRGSYFSKARFDELDLGVDSATAWIDAISISWEFAESFTKGAVVDEDYVEASRKLLEWHKGWKAVHNVSGDVSSSLNLLWGK